MATESATETCTRVVLHNRPGVDKVPTESNFALERIEIPQCKDGEILVKTLYLSVDPYMRSRMNDFNEDPGARAAYLSPWTIGEPPAGGGVGNVVRSGSEKFKVGDIVESFGWPWQEFVVFSDDNPNLNKVGQYSFTPSTRRGRGVGEKLLNLACTGRLGPKDLRDFKLAEVHERAGKSVI